MNNLFYDGMPTIGSLLGFYMAMLWISSIATGSQAAHAMAMAITTLLLR